MLLKQPLGGPEGGEKGGDRIVEIGDGQVSDVVGWSPERLAQIWKIKS
jgi:hypothetical protein